MRHYPVCNVPLRPVPPPTGRTGHTPVQRSCWFSYVFSGSIDSYTAQRKAAVNALGQRHTGYTVHTVHTVHTVYLHLLSYRAYRAYRMSSPSVVSDQPVLHSNSISPSNSASIPQPYWDTHWDLCVLHPIPAGCGVILWCYIRVPRTRHETAKCYPTHI